MVFEFSLCFSFPSVYGGFSSASALGRGFKRSREEVVVKIVRSRREKWQCCLKERVDGEVGESGIWVGEGRSCAEDWKSFGVCHIFFRWELWVV